MSQNSNFQIVEDLNDQQLIAYTSKKVIAVDTELHGLKMNRDNICLIQLGDDARNVTLIRPNLERPPKNLKILLEDPSVRKLFHFALTDVAFFATSIGIVVENFRCTKVMSKIVRTYTESHGLKNLCEELLGIELSKQQQQTNWASPDLTQKQLEYAASDVYYLIEIYYQLEKMMTYRPPLPSGKSIYEINEIAQKILPGLVQILINGYGDRDQGWETSLFAH
ncbi:MAG: ribonuclease D [bacterium]